jgi:hypothetical protein
MRTLDTQHLLFGVGGCPTHFLIPSMCQSKRNEEPPWCAYSHVAIHMVQIVEGSWLAFLGLKLVELTHTYHDGRFLSQSISFYQHHTRYHVNGFGGCWWGLHFMRGKYQYGCAPSHCFEQEFLSHRW